MNKNGSLNTNANHRESIQDLVNKHISNAIDEVSQISSTDNDQNTNANETHLIKYNIPLIPKINQIQYQINIEISKLQKLFNELKTRDQERQTKLVISMKENNIQYASLISSEMNKIRQTGKAIWISKTVLDFLYQKIHSVSNFGDLVKTLTPSLTMIKSIRSMLFIHLMESEHDLRNISDLLIDVLINAGQVGGHLINFKIANNEASTVLDDATLEAEDKIRREFLPLPDLKI